MIFDNLRIGFIQICNYIFSLRRVVAIPRPPAAGVADGHATDRPVIVSPLPLSEPNLPLFLVILLSPSCSRLFLIRNRLVLVLPGFKAAFCDGFAPLLCGSPLHHVMSSVPGSNDHPAVHMRSQRRIAIITSLNFAVLGISSYILRFSLFFSLE